MANIGQEAAKYYTESAKGLFERLDALETSSAEQESNLALTVELVGSLETDIDAANGNITGNASQISVVGRKAVYVESYYDLKIAAASGYDYAPCIQAALDAAAGSSAVVVFPSGQNLQVGTSLRLKAQNGNHIFGNRCVLTRIGLTGTTDSPIMYFLSLDVIGGTTQSYNYNSGVYIHELKFVSNGYGVGYKHAIAGELYMHNCVFDSTLENGVVLSGTNGCHFFGCQFGGSKKGLFCARLAEDSYTINYTVQGTGWNDGIYVNGGLFNCPANGYGFYYSGTTSEGVIKISNIKLLGGTNSTGIYGRSFTNLIVDGGWSEYFNGGKVIFAEKDSTAGGYEPDSFVVKNFQFTNHGGTFPSTSDYSIYSNAVRTSIDDCVFNNNPNQQHIYFASGTPNSLRIAFTSQPTVIDTTFGTITIPKASIPDTRDLLINDGTNNYYLIFNADMGANGYKYNTYTYSTPSKARPKEWRYGTYTDDYTITRITNPVLSLTTTYTITSVDDNSGFCEVNRPIFQGVSTRSKCINWGGFGVIQVKNPMTR
jgi:hypothetical protein